MERLRHRWYFADNVVYKETECAVVAWICLGQDSEKWRKTWNSSFKFYKIRGISWIHGKILPSQERFWAVETISYLVKQVVWQTTRPYLNYHLKHQFNLTCIRNSVPYLRVNIKNAIKRPTHQCRMDKVISIVISILHTWTNCVRKIQKNVKEGKIMRLKVLNKWDLNRQAFWQGDGK